MPFVAEYMRTVQLLALLGIGFTQGLYALDAADGQSDQSDEVFLWPFRERTPQ